MGSLEHHLSRVSLGRSILFLGAGFSTLATNIENSAPPVGNKLRIRMANDLGEPDDVSMETLAEEYLKKKHPQGLLALLRNAFTIKDVSQSQKNLLSFPWRQIYTTNFDDSAEIAAAATGKALERATLSDQPSAYEKGSACVHLNGALSRTNTENIRDSLILTSTQYASDRIKNSRWASVLRTDIDLADAIFFVGYSLFDIDIERILFRNPANISKTFFILGPQISRETELKIANYGSDTKIDTDEFVKRLELSAQRGAPDKSEVFLTNFEEIIPKSPIVPSATDAEVISFLIEGDLRTDHLYTDLANKTQSYHVHRNVAESIAKDAIGERKRILVHGNIGSGKSVLMDICAYHLANYGHRVFSHSAKSNNYARDIQYMESIEDPYVIIFEDLYSHNDIANLLFDNIPNAKVISTVRTTTYEIRSERIRKLLREDFSIYDTNTLTSDETASTRDILDRYGLWAERANFSERRKLDFIARDCKSEFRTVLLSILGSGVLQRRLQPLVQKIATTNSLEYRGFVTALALAYAEFPVSIGSLSEILQADLFRSAKSHEDELVREFLDLKDNRVRTRSPLFAEYVLSKIIPDDTLVDVISEVVVRSSRLALDQKRYRVLVRKMMRFGFIERILSEQEKPRKLVSFYEELRRTGVGERDPQFWLQYAIARMSFEDYTIAEKYFQTSFSLAEKRRGYDTYQIDNQYSKFLLESRYKSNHWHDHYAAFLESHRTLTAQMRNMSEGYYPYRVAKLYLEFVETLHGKFDNNELATIRAACEEILELINGVSSDMKKRLYVRDCKTSMQRTIEFIDETL